MTTTAFYCQRYKHKQRGTITLLIYHHNLEKHYKRWTVSEYQIKWEPENDLLINTLRFSFGQLTFAINDCYSLNHKQTYTNTKDILGRFYRLKHPLNATVVAGFWTTLSGSRYRLIDWSGSLDPLPPILKERRGTAKLIDRSCRIKDVSPVIDLGN
nr:ORF75 [Acipenserid herpesvirus 1]